MSLPFLETDIATGTAEAVSQALELEVTLPGLRGPRGQTVIPFGAKGPVSGTGPGTVPYFPRVNGEIIRVTAACSNQISGSTLVDVDIDGVSIYTDQSQRPNLASTGRHFDDGGTIGAGSFTDTQAITVDRDSIGVGLQDLIVTVEYVASD